VEIDRVLLEPMGVQAWAAVATGQLAVSEFAGRSGIAAAARASRPMLRHPPITA
jgi:hypothetical protein